MSARGPLDSKSFPTTSWTLVGRAVADAADPAALRQALTELLNRYLPALRAHLSIRDGWALVCHLFGEHNNSPRI